MKNSKILKDLNQYLQPALGCTDPVSIAYAAACARNINTGSCIKKIRIEVSGNLIKNAAAVLIPNTKLSGIRFAAAIGAVINNPTEKLEIMKFVTDDIIDEAVEIVNRSLVEVVKYYGPELLYISAEVSTETEISRAVIMGAYTNLVQLSRNNQNVSFESNDLSAEQSVEDYSIEDIIDFSKNIEISSLDVVKKAIQMNSDIAQEGQNNMFGLNVGQIIKNSDNSNMWINALGLTASASDARMGGSGCPVMSNSGSGNQGILTIIPVIEMGKSYKSETDSIVRACTLSSLITIYIKKKFGILSAMCSTTVSSCGAAAGITFLKTQDSEIIKKAIQTTIGNVAGILCDGAKASCSLKVATCTFAALLASELAINGKSITKEEGFIEENIEDTISNYCELSVISCGELDSKLLQFIMGKE